MHTIKDIAAYIKENDSFFLATHINPEGDAIGSAVALSMALDQMGKKSIVFDRDGVPALYRFMPGAERVKTSIVGVDTESLSLILLDCNDPERAAVEKAVFKRTAVIDHHATERGFGDIRWIDPRAPACGLMVHRLVKELGAEITKEMAINLYTAIAIDTGTFRYGNTTSEALRAGAELIEAGAQPGLIAESLYETWSAGRFRLLCHTLGTLQTTDGIAIITVTSDMLRETGTEPDDTEGFAGMPRMAEGVKVSALFRQIDGNSWKVSLRSKREADVASVAESFGGGGHRNAAGYKIDADLKTAKELLIARVSQKLK